MNQLYAYLFVLSLLVSAAIPIIGYLKSKYYYIDTKPIHYYLNKKQRTKKRYKTFKKRNKKHLSVNKINRIGALSKYSSLNKLNK